MPIKKNAISASDDISHYKQRTREHVIADLSANYVERIALKCGYVVRAEYPDYSLDLRLQTFDEIGNAEGEQVWLQLKATDGIQDYKLKTDDCFSFPIETKDFRYWIEAVVMPVFLILYDAIMEEAYWLDVKDRRGNNLEVLATPASLSGRGSSFPAKPRHAPKTASPCQTSWQGSWTGGRLVG